MQLSQLAICTASRASQDVHSALGIGKTASSADENTSRFQITAITKYRASRSGSAFELACESFRPPIAIWKSSGGLRILNGTPGAIDGKFSEGTGSGSPRDETLTSSLLLFLTASALFILGELA
jgi:hypothetical protein